MLPGADLPAKSHRRAVSRDGEPDHLIKATLPAPFRCTSRGEVETASNRWRFSVAASTRAGFPDGGLGAGELVANPTASV